MNPILEGIYYYSGLTLGVSLIGLAGVYVVAFVVERL